MWTWIIAIVVVAIALCTWMAMKPPPNVGDRTKLERSFSQSETQLINTVTISPDELSKATCDEDAKCWIAVDGVVYGMGVFPKWARGVHHGVKAGADGTEKFVKSGHAVAILQKMPVVGAYKP